jgi:hypothetical protein
LLTDDFEHSGVPDAVWLTLKNRKAHNLPMSLVIIGDTGYGPYYAIDTAQKNTDGESPVIEWWSGLPDAEGNGRVIASDFGKFFLELVQESLARGTGRQDTRVD